MLRRIASSFPLCLLLGLAGAALGASQEATSTAGAPDPPSIQPACGYLPPSEWLRELRAAVARGEIPDPADRPMPAVEPRTLAAESSGGSCALTSAHVFPFEDTNQLLLTDFSDVELILLMVDAANALLSVHGDNYDFIGFWLNFTPHHTLGAAFYKPIENDVLGIGDPSTIGTPIFNWRPDLGLAGDELQGFLMMWDVNAPHWEPGDGPGADFTRLAVAHEFEHRFSVFLPDLLDGRRLQGNDASCGRTYHWNWKVDGQGSAMEISEWVGSNPAILEQSFVSFNTDIAGGVYSYTDLYLMGYVPPEEMDAGNSELRYMNQSACASTYNGAITSFSSAQIIAAAGPRIPDSDASQKHYRTGWIVIHPPGDPPSPAELAKTVGILEQHVIDMEHSKLGRGSVNVRLFDDCNCNDVPDSSDISNGTSIDGNGNGIPDECECSLANYCVSSPNSVGSGSFISYFGTASVAANDFSVYSEGNPPGQNGVFFMGPQQSSLSFGNGVRCVAGTLVRFPVLASDIFGIAVQPIDNTLPPALGRIVSGATWNWQFWYRDPAGGGAFFNLSDALEATYCP